MSIKFASLREFAGRSRKRGMTLIELTIAIVILGVSIAGVMIVYTVVTRSSGDPVITKQMNSIAEELMEEISLKTYSGVGTAPSGCARNTFVGVSDYNNYSQPNYCDIVGATVLTGYAVSITVAVDGSTLPGVSQAKKIVVKITYGTQSLSLTSWRTNYAS